MREPRPARDPRVRARKEDYQAFDPKWDRRAAKAAKKASPQTRRSR